MAEGITLKRIIDMDEAAELSSSDYALVDSATGGPKKFAIGQALEDLKDGLSDVEGEIYSTLARTLEQGSLNSSTGAASTTSQAKRVRTADFISISRAKTLTVSDGFQLNVFWYGDADYKSSTGFLTDKTYDIANHKPQGATRIKVVLKKTTNADFTPADVLADDFQIITSNIDAMESEIYALQTPTPFAKSKAFCKIEKIFNIGNGNSGECFATHNGVTQLWGFNVAADDHSAQVSWFRKPYDRTTQTFGTGSSGKHNLGHVNSCSYNGEKDAFVCGNGSDAYGTTGQIFIIENAFDKTNLLIEDALVIDFSGYGSKVNVVWGDFNNELYNVVFCITNDGYDIYRVELGEGSTALESGTLQKTTGFNGTYKILQHWEYGTLKADYANVVQSAFFTGNNLGWGFGHHMGVIPIHRVVLFNDGKVDTEEVNLRSYDASGTEKTTSLSGAAWIDGYTFIMYSSRILMVKD